MRKAFADYVTRAALANPKLVLVTGDFCFGMFDRLKAERPKQYLNLGTAEQSMVGIAAGMAIGGLIPVVYTITPFLIERAFEQVKLDVVAQNLHVILVGFDDYRKDGPTHNPVGPGTMCSLLRLRYNAPSCQEELANVLDSVLAQDVPAFIRITGNRTPAAFKGTVYTVPPYDQV